MIAALRSDFHFALRQLRKSSGFALAAVLTLALGIGATTAVYSLVDGVLLRPLPLPDPERLVALYTEVQQPGQSPWQNDTSYPDYVDWRDNNHTFDGLAALDASSHLVNRPGGSTGEVIDVNHVSANYFSVLGIEPSLGRNFASEDDQPGHHVAILSYGYSQRTFPNSPSAIGSTILVSDRPYTIIGIMPQGFVEPRGEQAQLWISFAADLEGSAPRAKLRQRGVAEIVGRLKPGVTIEQARADLSSIQSGIAQRYPESRTRNAVQAIPKLSDITGDVRPSLLTLMAAVLAVLLIVCANVAGLMLSRTLKRRGEIALRGALGASRWRIWRQLLIESLMLGLIGAAAGTALAYLLLRLTLSLIPEDIPRLAQVGINVRVLAFTLTISLLCAVLSSLLPAWKLCKTQPLDALREQGSGKTAGRSAHRLQNTLVVTQTALGFALLIASGLLIRGFVNVRHVKTGYNSDHLFEFGLPLTPTRYPDPKKVLYYDQLLPQLAALPGVRDVSAGYPLPLAGVYRSAPLEIDGRQNPPDSSLTTLVGVAQPNFFETLEIPLLHGRNFSIEDNNPKSPLVTIVNQTFVKQFFPNENPIGHHIRPDLTELRNQAKDIDPTAAQEREIIGVVADFQQNSPIDPPQPFAVFPYAQASALMRPRVVMRVAGDPMSYQKSAQAGVAGIDPNLFLLAPESATMQLADRTGSQRFETMLIAGFGFIALLLTGLGLYASLAAMVASRTREIGVRLSVGARRNHIASLVLVRAATLVLSGVSLGAIVALAVSRALQAKPWWHDLLFGVTWFEPATYSLMLLALGVVSIAACLVPTWRAVRVDPMCVLRDE